MDPSEYSFPSGRGAWSVSSEEFSRHYTYFLHLVPAGGLLSGDRAREFFLQTNVPPLHLAHIWKLSDVDCNGRLDGAEFCIAMCLIHHWLSGAHLPTSLPPPLITFYHQVMWPRLPAVSEEHVLKCRKVFEVFQKNVKSGKMIGKAAKYLLNKSNLPVEQLHHIWSLSDKDGDGKFTFPEFTIAMHLIFLAKVGFLLPVNLEPSALLPSNFSKLVETSNLDDPSQYLGDETTPTNTPTPTNNNSPIDNRNNPFITEAFVDLPTSHFQEGQLEDSPGNPFLTLMNDLARESEIEKDLIDREIAGATANGAADGMAEGDDNLRYLYPGSREAIELPSQLSIIPEERNEDQEEEEEEEGEGQCDDHTPQDNATAWYMNSASQQTDCSQGEEEEPPLPWYHESGASQDTWQTTPAYRSEEVWPVVEETKAQTKFLSPLAKIQKAIVTEETVPELQVAMAVEVISKSPLLMNTIEGLENEEEEEGLTAEDLADLDKMEMESNQFLREHGVSDNATPPPHNSLLLSKDLQDVSRRGLEAAIEGVENTSPSSQSPPLQQVTFTCSTDSSNRFSKLSSRLSEWTDRSDYLIAEVDGPLPINQPPSLATAELELLAGLEEEMRNITELTDDIDRSTREVSAALDQDLPYQMHGSHNSTSLNMMPSNSSNHSQNSSRLFQSDLSVDNSSNLHPLLNRVQNYPSCLIHSEQPPPRPPLPRSSTTPPPRPPLPVSPRPLSQSPSPGPASLRHVSPEAVALVHPPPPPTSGETGLSSSFQSTSHISSLRSTQPLPPLTKWPPTSAPPSLEDSRQPCPPPPSPLTPSAGSDEVYSNSILSGTEAVRSGSSRRRNKYSSSSPTKMDDLDSLFEGEMASINEMFQEFEIKDKQNKKRQQLEQEDLKRKSVPSADVLLPKVSLDEVSKRRSREAQEIEREFQEKMAALEREQLEAQQPHAMDPTDIILQNLDNELQSLIKSKEDEVKQTQIGKELYAQRKREEKERKEKERLERLARQKEQGDVQELTIEEWIAWMEEKKKKGMTEEQVAEYERRKAARQELERKREEKRKMEEEEQKRKTKEKIESEIRNYRIRAHEVKKSRLTDDEIRQNFEEMARKNEEESRERREKGVKMREERKKQELEELQPKARSALAARWEESVKAKTKGGREEQRATVVSRVKKEEENLEREEERLTRRISGSFPNGTVNLSPEKKRHSSHT